MSWDAWALLSIIALCAIVITRTVWDSRRLGMESRRDTLRLSLFTGGHLEIPCPPCHPTGRHRIHPSR
ncbi:hypothetical protein [Nocardia seriolae]|uniref:hypothetical protein n=1 Tax=Nocardia seriolae TaxID=37332 RepID=UPI0008FF1747|nr:hypothetical protein [Nocardia seriolae]OJF79721.1 hypothetical protein NS14008_11580 [Nocardia seriolae]PSK26610.1 hypothetical protein C6575_36340 [Nocardia seriolae]QUN16140.1 hypothetical protein KEC46_28255 [Nocardia seriolae]WNJ56807.1 hypothetical protein RMO66_25515 [Nocardia seriolae]